VINKGSCHWDTYNDKVEDAVLQHVVREGLAIIVSEVHEQLQEILLGLVVTCLAALADDVERKFNDGFLVLGDLLVDAGPPFHQSPGSKEQTLADGGIQAIKRSRKLDLLLGVGQAAKGLTKRDPNW